MLLIADSGSSKTDWRLITPKGALFSFHSEGLNPYYKTIDQIKSVLQKSIICYLTYKPEAITSIYFYGAGCSVQAKCEEVKQALAECFPAANIHIYHDILGAARACCAHEKGIVCILGTGSNSCYYDGANITQTIGGLGYILGDEGSGCHIGKTILAAYLNQEMPKELQTDFYNTYNLNKAEIFEKVNMPNANRFLASFSLFAEKHKTNAFIKNIIERCFELFINTHICRYPNHTDIPVHFVGSVAYHYQDILIDLCKGKGITTGKFVLEPAEELVKFHQKLISFK